METEGKLISGRKAKLYEFLTTLKGMHLVHAPMIYHMKLSGSEEILDVGCGPGTLLFLLSNKCVGSAALHGVDPSEDMIAVAQHKNKKRNAGISFKVGAGERLEFEDNTFDWVISSLTFHHLPRHTQIRVGEEMLRVLKPAGRALVADWGRPRNTLGRMLSTLVRKHAFTDENLRGSVMEALQKAGFKEVKIIDVRFGIIEYVVGAK